MSSKNTMSIKTSQELLSYIINSDPVLSDNIDLPVQGESIAPIGKLILNNQRYRNAFINTVNLIAVTVIKRNTWDNPWDNFTLRGNIRNGQSVREIINDLANVYDYNQEKRNDANNTRFLKTVVPNVLNYIHDINFQKFYQVTTSDEQLAMAFEQGDLFSYIDNVVNMLFESFAYDRYVVNKYMLCRRIVDGTIPAVQIVDFATKTDRDIVADIKAVSNKMTFRSPNYNPAGIRRATSFDNQIAIVNTDFDAKFSTNVLATSYFRSDADMKARLALIDSFSSHDTQRLAELFAVRNSAGVIQDGQYLDGYVPFTDAELEKLAEIPAVIIPNEWFMNYRWAFDGEGEGKTTNFYNPTTLENNHYLHAWLVMSTSPFENCAVFTQTAQAVSSVSVSPSTASVTKGQNLQLAATVNTTGFANKSVMWSVDAAAETKNASITQEGLLKVPANFNTSGSGTAGVYTLTISTALATDDTITINGVTYTVAAADDTAAKQITALKTAMGVATITDVYSIGGTSTTMTLTEKSGYYNLYGEPDCDIETTNGVATFEETTPAVTPANLIYVVATSIYDNSKSAVAKITVS